ncbi:MAG: rod shape-determining protein MreC [Rhodospirillaceae bacterium]|nr:rod shape-determining protein MreC [Rhodospirillaceae bacterium]
MRAMAQRFSLLVLTVGAIALMMLGKIDAVLVDNLRARVTDAVAPILDAVSQPAATVSSLVDEAESLVDLREENARLRAENTALVYFRDAAYRLEEENASLRALTNFQPAVPHSFISARVIADQSGSFVRSLAINLGSRHGIADGQAVLGARGLVGRIVQTGERSARVLLLTDLNARVPVVVSDSRIRAVLGGDNTERPRLFHLVADHDVQVGDRITTSGNGGMFPPGLPVGMVESVRDGVVRVQLFEDLTRLEYVRIVDFSGFIADSTMRPAPLPPR